MKIRFKVRYPISDPSLFAILHFGQKSWPDSLLSSIQFIQSCIINSLHQVCISPLSWRLTPETFKATLELLRNFWPRRVPIIALTFIIKASLAGLRYAICGPAALKFDTSGLFSLGSIRLFINYPSSSIRTGLIRNLWGTYGFRSQTLDKLPILVLQGLAKFQLAFKRMRMWLR